MRTLGSLRWAASHVVSTRSSGRAKPDCAANARASSGIMLAILRPACRPEPLPRALPLHQQILVVLVDDEAFEGTDELVADPAIEVQRIWVERGHANEHVRAVAQDPRLRPSQHAAPEPAISGAGRDAERLNVSGERSGHIENEQPHAFIAVADEVSLLDRIGERRPA